MKCKFLYLYSYKKMHFKDFLIHFIDFIPKPFEIKYDENKDLDFKKNK